MINDIEHVLITDEIIGRYWRIVQERKPIRIHWTTPVNKRIVKVQTKTFAGAIYRVKPHDATGVVVSLAGYDLLLTQPEYMRLPFIERYPSARGYIYGLLIRIDNTLPDYNFRFEMNKPDSPPR